MGRIAKISITAAIFLASFSYFDWQNISNNSDLRKKAIIDSKNQNVLNKISNFSIEAVVDYYTLPPWKFMGHEPPKRFDDTPAQHGLKYQRVTIESYLNHIRLDSWYIPARGSDDKAVVICHANGGSKSDMLKYAQFLSKAGYNIFMFDFRAQGKSSGKYVTYGSNEKEDLRAAIDYLKKEKGIKRIAVYGQRMGAATAFIEDSQHHNIDAIISDSCWAEVKNIAESYARRFKHNVPKPFMGTIVDIIHLLSGIRTNANYSELNILNTIKVIDETPVLLIHNKNDPLYSYHNSINLYKAIGPYAELFLENYDRNMHVPSKTLQKKVVEFLSTHFN